MILQRLFSKSKKEKTLDKIDDKTSKSLKVGGSIAAGSILGNAILLNKVNNISEKSKINSSEKDRKLFEKLADTFKKEGGNLYKDLEGGPCTVSSSMQNLTGAANYLKSHDPSFNPKKSSIFMSGVKDPSFLAHEMGHAHFYDNKKANKLLRVAHKFPIYKSSMEITPFAAGAIGFKSGKNSVKHEKEGTKESKLSRLSGVGTGLVGSTPMFASEVAASHKGLQYLKQHGADLKQIKRARKNLAIAGGTYLGIAGLNTAIGEVGRGLGRAYAKMEDKK